MRKFSLVEFSIARPKLVVSIAAIVTLAFLTQFTKITTDTNPKNMLPKTSDVRVWNDEVDKTFGLYEDMMVLGIVNEKGVLNKETLGKIARITDEVLKINGVASRDVSSFPTITNVSAEEGTLKVAPLMTEAPKTDSEVEALSKTLYGNPNFINRIISKDGKTTAIYIPLEKGANGKEIADRLKEIMGKEKGRGLSLFTDEAQQSRRIGTVPASGMTDGKGNEEFYIAGDPVARDTFGAEMFKLMGMFAPIAGVIMFVAIYLMFRNLALCMAMMMVAMVSIIWSMGLLIGIGFPIHIMSSMAPVFLMAIATDSIHIFNEFYFRYREKKDKKAAIIETMAAVGRPVKYTALATAIAFGVLLFMQIIPVKVFGGMIAFGTIVLRLLSFSLIPAVLTFIKEEKIEKAAGHGEIELSRSALFLKGLGSLGAKRPKSTILIGLVLVAVSVVGITKIVVNNNMVEWFSRNSEVRIADGVINQALGGTSLGYIVATSDREEFIKTPEAMRYIEGLQRHLEELPVVGKTFSTTDYVKTINRVLHDEKPEFYTVPDAKETIGQYLFLFGMSAKQSDLDNVVDPAFQKANIWVQLKTWDATAMRDVIKSVDEYKKNHPIEMELKPAGTAYFNLVWNDEVLWDMVKGFVAALIVVFIILVFNFRSVKWAIVGYVPLLFTILLIYGVVGFMGKDFDMPIAVLSCLSLGMAVDFAIHFISRFRQRLVEINPPLSPLNLRGDERGVTESLIWTAARPGKGIMRNALLFASAFSVMLFAPLTPYITVGAFIVSMMLLSALMTIIYIPALIVLMRGWLFKVTPPRSPS